MSTRISLTYEDYITIPADGLRHEIIDGEHFVNPAPNLHHQHVSRHLLHQLMTKIEMAGNGVVLNAPVDVQLGSHDIIQPDLVFVSSARRSILTTSRIKGVPDLVIEILSPSNEKYDLHVKRQLYERFAVPEYWIVHPDKRSVLQLVLIDDCYREKECFDEIVMTVPPYTHVDLTCIW